MIASPSPRTTPRAQGICLLVSCLCGIAACGGGLRGSDPDAAVPQTDATTDATEDGSSTDAGADGALDAPDAPIVADDSSAPSGRDAAMESSAGSCNATGCTLLVNPESVAGASPGTVSVSAPGAVSCGTNCFLVPIGMTATLTAMPPSSGVFAAWGGDCASSGSAAQCAVTMTTSRTVPAFFRPPYNLMFTTSTGYDPAALGAPSIATADGYCAARAAAGHLGGTRWLAWLSTSSTGAASRLSGTGGWLRTDGRLFATDIDSLTAQTATSSGVVYNPPRVDELGTDNPSVVEVATGTNPDGTVSAGNTCSDFTDATQPSPLFGVTTKGSFAWTAAFELGGGTYCGAPFPIYCFEADFTSTPPRPQVPVSSRIAFRSTGGFDAATGLSGADALCAGEASTAGLVGTFIALLPTSTASATSRLSFAGANWYRPDGVQITSTPADLGKGAILAPMDVSADATSYFADDSVYTGSDATPDQVSTAALTCLDWTSNSSASNAYFGEGDDSYIYFWHGGHCPCVGASPVYCVQQ